MRQAVVVAGLLLMTSGGVSTQPPRVPVLVELFTSEGCSSCPPADDLLAQLEAGQPIAGAEVVPLGLHVDYWDRLGWKDAYAQAAFTARQRAYAGPLGDDGIYTPQVVVDGRTGVVGSDDAAVRSAIVAAARRPHLAVRVTARESGGRVQLAIDVPAAPAGSEPLALYAALTQGSATSQVARGENRGRTLRHVAVARSLTELGTLDAEAAVLRGELPVGRGWDAADLRAVVWIQGRKSREVVGVATARVAR